MCMLAHLHKVWDAVFLGHFSLRVVTALGRKEGTYSDRIASNATTWNTNLFCRIENGGGGLNREVNRELNKDTNMISRIGRI